MVRGCGKESKHDTSGTGEIIGGCMSIGDPSSPEKITKAKYATLTLFEQGFVSAVQGGWNSDIPASCPYEIDSRESDQWFNGFRNGRRLSE